MKLSIITVAFNSAKTLADTIRSVECQSYPDIEYLLIDGGSTDGTQEIIQSFEPQFKGRMRWISEKDQGIYDAMNKGLAMATGEVVSILNSDDFYLNPHVAQTVMQAFDDPQIGATTGNLYFVDREDPQKIYYWISARYARPGLFAFGMVPPHACFFARRKYYNQWGNFDASFELAADADLMYRFLSVEKLPFKFIDQELVAMRVGGASTTNEAHKKKNTPELLRAYKKNRIYSNWLFIRCRFFLRLWATLQRKGSTKKP